MAPGAVMALSQRDLEEIEAAAERGSTRALENLGLFARDERGVLRWRRNFNWLDDQRQASEKINHAVRRYGWLAALIIVIVAFKLDAMRFLSSILSFFTNLVHP